MEEKLVNSIFQSVVKENIGLYTEILNMPLSEVTDSYWRDVIMLYNNCDKINKRIIVEIFRHVIVDTVSTFLGIIDGSSILENFEHELKLKVDNTDIEDGLQDMFLELIEEMK